LNFALCEFQPLGLSGKAKPKPKAKAQAISPLSEVALAGKTVQDKTVLVRPELTIVDWKKVMPSAGLCA
jgi:hypothetical protein